MSIALLLQVSFAQTEMTALLHDYDATHRSLDLMSWWIGKEIYYEAPGVLEHPDIYVNRPDFDPVETMKWTLSQPRSDEDDQLSRYLQELNGASLYFKPKGFQMKYRLVQTSSNPDCNINSCTAIEIIPASGDPSPLDVPLGLADGEVSWPDVAAAYRSATGHLIRLNANRNPLPDAISVTGNPTLRTYLHEACHNRCSWSFASRTAPGVNGGHLDLLALSPRGATWLSGREAAQDSYRKNKGSLLPGSYDAVPVSTP